MITIRRSSERGQSHVDWLTSFHTFSFSSYYDANFMHFGNLRVINEDTVTPGMGFGTHAHRDMEILTYVVKGTLEHKDSLGTGSIIKTGEIQRMSAGSGVEHSEFNHSKTQPLHFLQIWIIPEKKSISPSYEQKAIPQVSNELILIGSPKGGDHAVVIHQDVKLFVAYMTSEKTINYAFESGRRGWIQLIKGQITVDDHRLMGGDGVGIKDVDHIQIMCEEGAEFLLFDMG